jgi:uncharacterized Fe-S cluster protein YjdI
MKKYRVRVASPTVYEIEADNRQEAVKRAVALFKLDRHTWIDPEIVDAEEITAVKKPKRGKSAPAGWKVYKGKVEEDDEYLS